MGRLDLDDAADAVAFATAYGLTPDDWQAWVIEGWLGLRGGKLAASRCGLAVPRQNGKNAILEAVELFKLVVQGRRILHTAHEVKTARKAFLRLCSFFENARQFPELAKLVPASGGIRRTNGQEAIFLTNGASVEFIARSKGSGRGFTVDDLVCDEAQELSDDALAALYPTISSAPSGDPQLILTGTPPSPSMVGEVFTRFRTAGVVGKDARFCWDEWSVPGGADLDDRANWAKVNPALGIRLGLPVIVDERAAMDDVTFGRERLGMWDEDGYNSVFPAGAWAAVGVEGSSIVGGLVFGLAVSLSREMACIGAAGFNVDGAVHLEPIEHAAGVDWIVARARELTAKHGGSVVVDGHGPAGALIPELQEAGVPVSVVKVGEVCDGCASLFDAVKAGTVRHLNDPRLNAAVVGARQRPVGDRYAWGRKSSEDITPLEAVTLAFWGASNAPNYDVLDSVH